MIGLFPMESLMPTSKLFVLGLAAFSGVGKTTLLKQLIPLLRQRGVRVGLVKATHHEVEVDQPGKDSYLLRQAGAEQVLLTSPQRWALMAEVAAELDLPQALAKLDQQALDLVLVEGFRQAEMPKIELHRPALGHPLLCLEDRHIVALACDAPPAETVVIPQLDLNDSVAIADFILSWRGQNR